jgi:UPF0716 protein FxsA
VLAALLLWPVLELFAAIEVGRQIGALATIGLLVVIAFIGAIVVRREGAAAWRSLNRSLRSGEPPARELADATVLMLAGLLLIIPGFITDVFAALLILPFTRPIARRPVERALRRAAANQARVQAGFGPGAGPSFGPGFGPGTGPSFGPGRRTGTGGPGFQDGDVVEGEIVDE